MLAKVKVLGPSKDNIIGFIIGYSSICSPVCPFSKVGFNKSKIL